MKNFNLILAIFVTICFTDIKAQNNVDHSVWDQLLILNVSEVGKVNYKGVMKDSSLFYEYFRSLSQNPPTDEWSREEKLAYWVNAYNAIALKMIIDNYPVESINELHDPWKQRFFKVNDKRYSLDDIEHEVLRKFDEPRIHFVINCASNSSPKLLNMAYTAENINEALEKCTTMFINDPSKNTITSSEVKVSKIFEWYKDDFNNGNVVDFINQYANVKINKIPKKGYVEYDWSLNEQL
ncbi:DUF547 domain-containing protein [Aquimarina sp. AD10]|uniref:DUF547 domain-containing protein n=1 Tax=Aquimarina TaxID=290174 RepID=UPI0009EDD293|nr:MULTISPECIES: DUF547 domain-containing protein [Aquimarina]AXT62530.1 DUF547 domain-containing protein [Aquimarina sp. AD10]RKM90278.1 DUF547 domain-containing protein [Aquimarina sp. AD10]